MIMQHFRNYDLDKNGNIDGLEILKAANRMNGEDNEGSVLMLCCQFRKDANNTALVGHVDAWLR